MDTISHNAHGFALVSMLAVVTGASLAIGLMTRQQQSGTPHATVERSHVQQARTAARRQLRTQPYFAFLPRS